MGGGIGGGGGRGGGGGGGGGGALATVPWTMGLSIVPRGSHAKPLGKSSVLPPQEQDGSRRTREGALAGRPSGCQRRCTTTPRSDPPLPVTNRLKVVDPLESASQSRLAREGVGLPRAHPRLRTSPDKERGLARLSTAPERFGRTRSRYVITHMDRTTGRGDLEPLARPCRPCGGHGMPH